MFSFENDYSEGACKEVLTNLTKTNYLQTTGYGMDEYCSLAAKSIKKAIEHDNVDVHFVPGGTPANVLAISTLKSYEAVICADNGHINVHETGAVEATGHKILAVKGVNGKLSAEDIKEVVLKHTDEHMVKPRMVFVSNPSEYGTIYSYDELKAISDMCKRYDLYLYMDGARLSNALAAKNNDLSLRDVCDLTDMFYIGGTKNGALFGEAFIIRNNSLKQNFRYLIKQHCSMMAKGRLLGVQFATLFDNDLYLRLASNANIMAQTLKQIFINNSIDMYIDSPTNQIFPIIENSLLEKIQTKYKVTIWDKYDEEHTVVRFVCSWATKQSDIENFYNDLSEFIKK